MRKRTKDVFSTHVLANVEQSNNEVVFLNDGEIVLSVAVEELNPHTKKKRASSSLLLCETFKWIFCSLTVRHRSILK